MSRQALAVCAILLLISGVAMGTAPPTCNQILSDLNTCIPYVTRDETKPSKTCCAGVKDLKKYAHDKAARQSICRCLESLAPMSGRIDYSLIQGLPKQCRVSLNLPKFNSPNFDCSKA